MDDQAAWNQFKKTGKVEHYLRFKEIQRRHSQETAEEVARGSQNAHYDERSGRQGAKGE